MIPPFVSFHSSNLAIDVIDIPRSLSTFATPCLESSPMFPDDLSSPPSSLGRPPLSFPGHSPHSANLSHRHIHIAPSPTTSHPSCQPPYSTTASPPHALLILFLQMPSHAPRVFSSLAHAPPRPTTSPLPLTASTNPTPLRHMLRSQTPARPPLPVL